MALHVKLMTSFKHYCDIHTFNPTVPSANEAQSIGLPFSLYAEDACEGGRGEAELTPFEP